MVLLQKDRILLCLFSVCILLAAAFVNIVKFLLVKEAEQRLIVNKTLTMHINWKRTRWELRLCR